MNGSRFTPKSTIHCLSFSSIRTQQSPFHHSLFIIHHSPVYLAEHNINGADDGYYVGDQVSAHHSVESLEVHERRRTHAHAVGTGSSVTHHEVAQLAFGRFNRVVDLGHRRLDHLRYLAHDGPRRDAVDRLADDTH